MDLFKDDGSPSLAPQGPYRAAFSTPLTFTLAPNWTVAIDVPSQLMLTENATSVPNAGPVEPYLDLVVTIEQPSGYPNAASFLAGYGSALEPATAGAASGLPVSYGCVGWTDTKAMQQAGLTGTGFSCDGSVVTDIGPLYPESQSAFETGFPSGYGDPSATGWFWPQGSTVWVFVADAGGKPLIITTEWFGHSQTAAALARAKTLFQSMQIQP